MNRLKRVIALGVVVSGLVGQAAIGKSNDKDSMTPYFCQLDSHLTNDGKEYCGPSSASDALIYLSRKNGLTNLAPGHGHHAQESMVKQLATDMAVGPHGCSVDGYLSGLQKYAQGCGCEVQQLQVEGWCKLSGSNQSALINKKPQLDWIRQAAADPDTAVIFNVGWFYKSGNTYTHKGAHFVDVVGVGPGELDFRIRNSDQKVALQKQDQIVTLTPLGSDFVVANITNSVGWDGFYSMKGPALPVAKPGKVGVLDSVIIFKVAQAVNTPPAGGPRRRR